MEAQMYDRSCGSTGDGDGALAASRRQPTIVVTTNIVGDVVDNIVGDLATVDTIMAEGSALHDFQPSAQQVNTIPDTARSADRRS